MLATVTKIQCDAERISNVRMPVIYADLKQMPGLVAYLKTYFCWGEVGRGGGLIKCTKFVL